MDCKVREVVGAPGWHQAPAELAATCQLQDIAAAGVAESQVLHREHKPLVVEARLLWPLREVGIP